MSEIGRALWTGLTTATPLDWANFLLGVFGVWLFIRRSLWAFPVGLVAVTVQGVLFWQSKWYADARLQLFYFGTLVYGWWHWVRHRGNAPELPVTRLSWMARSWYLLAGLVLTVTWAEYQRRYTDAVMPYRDAFVASFGFVGQILQMRKNLENWPVWVVVNAVTVASCLMVQPPLYPTAVLYVIYLALAVAGWREWQKTLAPQPMPSHAA